MGFLLFLFTFGFSKSQDQGYGYMNPDSLTIVTITGVAIVDSSGLHPMYYLDEDGDGAPDYHLNFGPYWYSPDSSAAQRPMDGDSITVTGGQYNAFMSQMPVIIVYDINGQFWRDPYNPYWTEMGDHMHSGDHHMGNCNGFAFGWMMDSMKTVVLDGIALVDTTFIMEQYYIDTNGDSLPDFHLNFGPPWYESESGAVRPQHGDAITIVGGAVDTSLFKTIVIYKINGEVWRDSSMFGHQFGGNWIYRNMQDTVTVHDPFDSDDQMRIHPGWYQMGGHYGGMMPDSMFARMLEIFPQNIPNADNQNHFAGFEIGMFNDNGSNMMWQNQSGCGGHMNFASDVEFRLHYNDIQLMGNGIDENSIRVKYWDDQTSSWITVSNATVDPANNTVTFTQTEVSNYVILTGEQVTSVDDESNKIAEDFTLEQNYPNPFNPSTTISFTLKRKADVKLTIYNILGRKVAILIDDNLNSGSHSLQFDAKNLSSGIYFYELKVDGKSMVKKMELIK